jgi:hypothetical protein
MADDHTALNVIARLDDGWQDSGTTWVRYGPEQHKGFPIAHEEPMTPEERAVLDQAKDPDHG